MKSCALKLPVLVLNVEVPRGVVLTGKPAKMFLCIFRSRKMSVVPVSDHRTHGAHEAENSLELETLYNLLPYHFIFFFFLERPSYAGCGAQSRNDQRHRTPHSSRRDPSSRHVIFIVIKLLFLDEKHSPTRLTLHKT